MAEENHSSVVRPKVGRAPFLPPEPRAEQTARTKRKPLYILGITLIIAFMTALAWQGGKNTETKTAASPPIPAPVTILENPTPPNSAAQAARAEPAAPPASAKQPLAEESPIDKADTKRLLSILSNH